MGIPDSAFYWRLHHGLAHSTTHTMTNNHHFLPDITLYPIEVSGPSESDRLSFEPEVRNDIYIRSIIPDYHHLHRHYLHDIELLDDAGLESTRSASLSILW